MKRAAPARLLEEEEEDPELGEAADVLLLAEQVELAEDDAWGAQGEGHVVGLREDTWHDGRTAPVRAIGGRNGEGPPMRCAGRGRISACVASIWLDSADAPPRRNPSTGETFMDLKSGTTTTTAARKVSESRPRSVTALSSALTADASRLSFRRLPRPDANDAGAASSCARPPLSWAPRQVLCGTLWRAAGSPPRDATQIRLIAPGWSGRRWAPAAQLGASRTGSAGLVAMARGMDGGTPASNARGRDRTELFTGRPRASAVRVSVAPNGNHDTNHERKRFLCPPTLSQRTERLLWGGPRPPPPRAP